LIGVEKLLVTFCCSIRAWCFHAAQDWKAGAAHCLALQRTLEWIIRFFPLALKRHDVGWRSGFISFAIARTANAGRQETRNGYYQRGIMALTISPFAARAVEFEKSLMLDCRLERALCQRLKRSDSPVRPHGLIARRFGCSG